MTAGSELPSRGVKSWSVAVFCVALMLVSILAVLSYRTVGSFWQHEARVQHTYTVLRQLVWLRDAIVDAETGARGYLITADPGELKPYSAAVAVIPQLLGALRRLTADNGVQQRRLDQLDTVVQGRLQLLADTIAATPAVRNGTRPLPDSDPGKALMDRTRSLIGDMQREELHLLDARTARFAVTTRRAGLLLGLGDIAAITTLISSFIALRAEIRRRRSAQIRAERSAEEAEELYNNAPCGYHSVDESGILLRINDTELNWLGYERDELVGKRRAVDLMTPECAALHWNETFPKFKRDGFAENVQVEYVRKDGSVMPALANSRLVRDARGRFVMSLTTLYDNTERRRAEQAIEQLNADLRARSEMLETANQELESFTYSVSHDLRTPLRAIDGYAGMLEDDYAERLDDEGRRLLGVVRENSRRMGELIDDLLALSRLGHRAVVKTRVDMNRLFGEIAAAELAANPGRRIEILQENLVAAWGDPTLLRQVVVNLVANAVKFSRDRDPAIIRITSTRHDGGSEYVVSDNGAGFDMRYYDKLFGVFQRLHHQHEYPGTGVGLAIVQRVVALHGGRVWAQGEVGRGASFHFFLATGDANGDDDAG
jgi:PAS domain S-box-containing protein